MAVIRPFFAVRPVPEYAEDVAALPYDVMNSAEAREMVKGKPYSFLHIDRAEIDLPEGTGLYEPAVYETAAANLKARETEGVFIREESPCLYIYRLVMNGRAQTGLVVCASIDDYMNNVIKKHELTRAEKEEDRVRHVDALNANTGPIFLTYRHVDGISSVIDTWKTEKEALYDFTAEDGVRHTVWRIDDAGIIEALTGLFENVPSFYIADGHHRAASAVRVGNMRRKEHPDYDGSEEFNFFLSVLFPDDELMIMDYNRVVKDLNGLSEAEFLDKVKGSFETEASGNAVKPDKKGTFGMYLHGKWYRLTVRKEVTQGRTGTEALDVTVLQEALLTPVLGIGDPRTDERISFVGGIRGLSELEKRVDQGEAAAFSMYPTTVEELMEIADLGGLMPPKSTWFEPKLRSGLFIHELD